MRRPLLLNYGVVITGAGSGMGRCVAHAVAQAGAGVVVNDVDVASVRRVAREIANAGGRAIASGASIASWEESAELIDTCVGQFGAIDGLVNNPALDPGAGQRPKESEQAIRGAVEIAILGTISCGVHAMRHMRERGGGSIVNVTSTAHMGSTSPSAYVAAMGALASVTYGWALELLDDRVRVNALAAGSAAATIDVTVDAAFRPEGRCSSTATTSALVYLLSDLSSSITGQVFATFGTRFGLVEHPKLIDRTVERNGWTAEQIAAVISSGFSDELQPVGSNARDYHAPHPAKETA